MHLFRNFRLRLVVTRHKIGIQRVYMGVIVVVLSNPHVATTGIPSLRLEVPYRVEVQTDGERAAQFLNHGVFNNVKAFDNEVIDLVNRKLLGWIISGLNFLAEAHCKGFRELRRLDLDGIVDGRQYDIPFEQLTPKDQEELLALEFIRRIALSEMSMLPPELHNGPVVIGEDGRVFQLVRQIVQA